MTNKISYVGVKGIICDGDKILVTQEPLSFPGGGKWELPGGKLANGEEVTPLEQILSREIQEELGGDVKVSVGELFGIIRRPWNKPGSDADMVFLATYQCEYLGGRIKLSDENHAFSWITKGDLLGYDFVPGYLPVLTAFFERTPKVKERAPRKKKIK